MIYGLPPVCPRCGRDLEWDVEDVTNGIDPAWLSCAYVDCACGLSLEAKPDGQASMWPRQLPAEPDLFLSAMHAEETLNQEQIQ